MHIEFYKDGSFSLVKDKREIYVSQHTDDTDELPGKIDYIDPDPDNTMRIIPIENFIKAIKTIMEQE